MPTRFTAHKNGKPLAPARTTWGDALTDVRQTSIVKVWPLRDPGKTDPIKDDPRGPRTMEFTRGFAIVVTR